MSIRGKFGRLLTIRTETIIGLLLELLIWIPHKIQAKLCSLTTACRTFSVVLLKFYLRFAYILLMFYAKSKI